MIGISSKKYREPKVLMDCVILESRDGLSELRVRGSVKYISTKGKSKVYSPRNQHAALANVISYANDCMLEK